MGSDFTNVTFDGIPESDTNDPSYHSTSFFPELIVGGVDLVRGPGLREPNGLRDVRRIGERVIGRALGEAVADDGLFSRQLEHADRQHHLQTGAKRGSANGSSRDLPKSRLERVSHRQQHLEPQLLFKYECRSASGRCSTRSHAGTTRRSMPRTPGRARPSTSSTIYGQNYSLNNNPASGECECYNFQIKTTDIGYLRLRSDLGWGFHLDNKLYTYRYDNETTAADTVG